MNPTHQNVTPDREGELEVETAPTWLKVLVVVLGLAIVGMLALIIFKVAAGDNNKDQVQLPPASNGVIGEEPALVQVPERLQLELPIGSEIVSMIPYGRELFFRVRHVSGEQEVFILNRLTGAVSRIEVVSAGS